MPLDVASIKTRVTASGLFGQVHDVVSLADAWDNPGAYLNSAFVVIPKESAEANRRDGGTHLQRVTCRVGISYPLQAQRLATNHSGEVEANRTILKRHMMGWQPTGAETAFDYAYSDISRTKPGFIWVNLFFDCKYLESAETVTPAP